MTKVAVLLATFNGRRWLPDQLNSILDQRGVEVTVIALDDGSTDGTAEWLAERASADPRIVVLPYDVPSGGAAANFYRLITRAELGGVDFISLSDQDDVWQLDKLSRHVELMRHGGYDAVSSSITSFDASGRRTLIVKSHPQREFDFLTESPGPGSTFLLTPRLVDLVRHVLDVEPLASKADYHDSLIYAITRARGWLWYIDSTSSVDYRQHDHNVMGANLGRASARARLGLIRSRWHRNQAVLHARVGLRVAPPEIASGIERMLGLMTTPGISARLRLASHAGSMRRRPRDRVIIGLLIAAGVW